MSLRYYIDHNVHAGITRGLRRRGIDCITAAEDGRGDSPDPDILMRATQLGRVIFTQDIDFLEIASGWMSEGKPFGGVVFARQMGITIGQAIFDLELLATALEPPEIENHVEWIPL